MQPTSILIEMKVAELILSLSLATFSFEQTAALAEATIRLS
jgi:hypothetical protein